MLLEVLPSSLLGSPNIEVLLRSKTSSIVVKSLSHNLVDKKMYLACVAILLVTKGWQKIRSYQGDDIIVSENEMVFLTKDLYIVSDFVTRGKNFEAVIFFIDDQLIKKFLLLHPVNINGDVQKPGVLKTTISSQIEKYTRALCEIYKKQKYNHSLLEIKVLEFLLLLTLHENTKQFVSALANPIDKRSIKEFMQQNYLSNLKIKDYAALTGRSISTFNRAFKGLYGTTPNKWLIQMRLSRAHELLRSTSLNVTSVSMEVGYENVSHFINAYKKRYGVTPKRSLNNK